MSKALPLDKEREHVRNMAASVYHELTIAQRAESYVRTVTERHQNHPAWQEYMREMMLTDAVAEFVARPSLRRT